MGRSAQTVAALTAAPLFTEGSRVSLAPAISASVVVTLMREAAIVASGPGVSSGSENALGQKGIHGGCQMHAATNAIPNAARVTGLNARRHQRALGMRCAPPLLLRATASPARCIVSERGAGCRKKVLRRATSARSLTYFQSKEPGLFQAF